MSDDLRERIDLAIARVPAGKAADAVLDAIAETEVIVDKAEYKALRDAAIAVLSTSIRAEVSPAFLDALCRLEREVYRP